MFALKSSILLLLWHLYEKGVGGGLVPSVTKSKIQAKPELLRHPPPSRAKPDKRQVLGLQQETEHHWKGQRQSGH